MANEQRTLDETIRELEETRNCMLRGDWDAAVEAADTGTQDEADRTLAGIQRNLRKLRNQRLEAILDELRANEAALRTGLDDLRRSRQNLRNVQAVLQSARAVLQVVGKVLRTFV